MRSILQILVLLLSLVNVLNAIAQQPSGDVQLFVGSDTSSLWRSPAMDSRGQPSSDWLRFYSDGTVIEVFTTGTATVANMENWFNAPYDRSSGRYTLTGSRIAFSIKGPESPESMAGIVTTSPNAVDYDGTVKGTSLFLNIFSHINQRSSRRVFDLVWEPKVRCPAMFRQTLSKNTSDLTVDEDRAVKACKLAGYYHE